MRMLSEIVAVIALGAAFAASLPASAEEGKQRFTHERYTYVYQVKETKVGQVISGRRYPDAVAFNLAVKKGKVQGFSGDRSVAFNVEDAYGATTQ